MTKEEAIQLHDTEWWKDLPARDIVGFQLFEEKLCMPFGDFQKAVEESLGRSVWTHEFGSNNVDKLKQEFLGNNPTPTWNEIINLIPEDKRVVISF